jgi:hypothetical protein
MDGGRSVGRPKMKRAATSPTLSVLTPLVLVALVEGTTGLVAFPMPPFVFPILAALAVAFSTSSIFHFRSFSDNRCSNQKDHSETRRRTSGARSAAIENR